MHTLPCVSIIRNCQCGRMPTRCDIYLPHRSEFILKKVKFLLVHHHHRTLIGTEIAFLIQLIDQFLITGLPNQQNSVFLIR